ncbi:hypothetical protein [Levilactobacillus spicheri]|uniref:Membrane protein 6-pyruvoyl-tetrahydropterin synthase-related domain-containing protein n=2 Tax=Levilactobacillus spicheri TaxID=216463 RepID=A0ABQ0WUX0_9LACO|nr:hypothetical protein [Levilactobacillus spicheri]KRL47020.1 hypothetical protein FD37_GL000502 [Levilactobacillus spicheri DSM 15429]GEO68034.1 hypothetical protein LSP04_24530 [Levilactobacillus spicheri]
MRQVFRQTIQKYWWQLELLAFVILSLLWILPWGFSGKLYTGDDLGFHLNRIQGLYQAFKLSGNWFQIPAVATTAFSAWGYPINLFYPALSLIPAAWIQAVATGVGGYYVYLILLNLVTLGIAAFTAQRILKSRAQGFLVAVIYGFAQYRFLDFFVRGALAEGIVFAFLPLIFYGIYCLTVGDDRRWYWLAIGMALIALTHVISLVLCAVGVVIMLSMWVLRRDQLGRRLQHLGLATGTAILLSLSFLGPLVEQLKQVGKLGVAQYTLADSATQLGDLLSNSLDNATASNQINFGVLFLILTVLAIVAWKRLTAFDRYCLILGWVFVFMATNLFPWGLFQGMLGVIQFPWRFLALGCFPLSLVGTRALLIVCHALNTNRQWWLIPLAAVVAVGLSMSTSERLYRQVGQGTNKIVTNANYQATATQDTTTDYVAQKGQVSMAAVRTHSIPVMNTQPNGQVPTTLQQQQGQNLPNGLIYNLHSTVAQRIKLPQIYYTGYHVYVNNREQQPRLDANGVVHVKVPAGNSQIRYVYQRTPIQRLTGWVSLLTWLGLLGTMAYRWFRRQKAGLSKD